jgi:hypothetical protein
MPIAPDQGTAPKYRPAPNDEPEGQTRDPIQDPTDRPLHSLRSREAGSPIKTCPSRVLSGMQNEICNSHFLCFPRSPFDRFDAFEENLSLETGYDGNSRASTIKNDFFESVWIE